MRMSDMSIEEKRKWVQDNFEEYEIIFTLQNEETGDMKILTKSEETDIYYAYHYDFFTEHFTELWRTMGYNLYDDDISDLFVRDRCYNTIIGSVDDFCLDDDIKIKD